MSEVGPNMPGILEEGLIESLENSIRDLKIELSNLESEKSSLLNSVEKYQKMNKELEGVMQKLDKAKSSCNKSHDSLATAYISNGSKEKVEKLNEECDNISKLKEQVQQVLNASNVKLKSINTKIGDYNFAITNTKVNIENAKTRINNLKNGNMI